jgi:hypothetical protein
MPETRQVIFMGRVYAGHDLTLDREVVIKTLLSVGRRTIL